MPEGYLVSRRDDRVLCVFLLLDRPAAQGPPPRGDRVNETERRPRVDEASNPGLKVVLTGMREVTSPTPVKLFHQGGTRVRDQPFIARIKLILLDQRLRLDSRLLVLLNLVAVA